MAEIPLNDGSATVRCATSARDRLNDWLERRRVKSVRLSQEDVISRLIFALTELDDDSAEALMLGMYRPEDRATFARQVLLRMAVNPAPGEEPALRPEVVDQIAQWFRVLGGEAGQSGSPPQSASGPTPPRQNTAG